MSLGQGNLLNNRYRIVEILGRGGMGAVYRAVDESLGVDVAVKENLFTTDDYARQFRMEAVILAGLRHPNLPRVTDHFVLDGLGQYLVMDYIEGDDLRQRIEKQGTLPESEAIRIGAAVCDALAYLHSRKPPILHRDIKLGNVKLTPEGGVLLVDFGLAKMAWEHEETMTGARAMTPGYSPPEQYGSARTDSRSDIYSLGATLYAAITGVVPEDSLMRAVDGLSLTPLRMHRPEISPRLAAAIEKAMETTPANRYQSADEFKAALIGNIEVETMAGPNPPVESPATNSQPIAVPERKSTPRVSFVRLFGLFLVLLLTAFGTIWMNPANRQILLPYLAYFLPTSTPTSTATASPTLALTATQELVSTPTITITPKRTNLPLASSTPTTLPTFTLTPTEGSVIVPPTESLATPVLLTPTQTPVGGSGEVAFASVQGGVAQIFIVNADGSNLRQLTNDLNGACDFDWSPDGKKLVYVTPCSGKAAQYNNSSLYVFDLETNTATPLLDDPKSEFDPAWSPDGARIAYTSFRDETWQIHVFDLSSGETIQLTTSEGNVWSRYPVWSPDGSQILYVSRRFGQLQLWMMKTDGGEKARFLYSGTGSADYLPAWSPDGTFILFSQSNIDLSSPSWLMRLNIGLEKAQRLSGASIPVVDVNFSPDGIWIAYESSDSRNQDIYLYNLLDGTAQQLTTDPAVDFDPQWRP